MPKSPRIVRPPSNYTLGSAIYLQYDRASSISGCRNTKHTQYKQETSFDVAKDCLHDSSLASIVTMFISTYYIPIYQQFTIITIVLLYSLLSLFTIVLIKQISYVHLCSLLFKLCSLSWRCPP